LFASMWIAFTGIPFTVVYSACPVRISASPPCRRMDSIASLLKIEVAYKSNAARSPFSRIRSTKLMAWEK